MDENEISYKIRGAIYKVYNELGPGLLESIVEKMLPLFSKQLLTYLKLTKTKLGILVNFNTTNIDENIKRIVNNL